MSIRIKPGHWITDLNGTIAQIVRYDMQHSQYMIENVKGPKEGKVWWISELDLTGKWKKLNKQEVHLVTLLMRDDL